MKWWQIALVAWFPVSLAAGVVWSVVVTKGKAARRRAESLDVA